MAFVQSLVKNLQKPCLVFHTHAHLALKSTYFFDILRGVNRAIGSLIGSHISSFLSMGGSINISKIMSKVKMILNRVLNTINRWWHGNLPGNFGNYLGGGWWWHGFWSHLTIRGAQVPPMGHTSFSTAIARWKPSKASAGHGTQGALTQGGGALFIDIGCSWWTCNPRWVVGHWPQSTVVPPRCFAGIC